MSSTYMVSSMIKLTTLANILFGYYFLPNKYGIKFRDRSIVDALGDLDRRGGHADQIHFGCGKIRGTVE